MTADINDNDPPFLAGVTVLELDNGLGEFAGKIFADAGADVVKVEPVSGAPSRAVGPYARDERDVNSSLQFGHYNTSKRSVVVDLTAAGGTAAVTELAAHADVVLDAMGTGVLDSLGLGYSALRAVNPHIIFCSVTPFGTDGPWAELSASDLTQLALGGVMASCGYDDGTAESPLAPIGGHSKHLAGTLTAMAALAAVIHRLNTGSGQFIDVSAHESIAVSTEMAVPFWLYQRREVQRHTARHAMPAPTPRWQHRCADGKHFLALPLYIDDGRFSALVEWFDAEGLAEDLTDLKYRDAWVREEEMFHIVDVIGRFCARHDSAYMFRESQARRLPWAPVNAPDDLLRDPHFTDTRATFVEVPDPSSGQLHQYVQLPHVVGQRWGRPRPAPRLGQHTDEVMDQPCGDAHTARPPGHQHP